MFNRKAFISGLAATFIAAASLVSPAGADQSFDDRYDSRLDGVLEARMDLVNPSTLIKTTEALQVRFTLTNLSDQDLMVLSFLTPLDGITHPVLSVSLDGVPVTYTGILAKRPAPRDEDFVLIPAGEQLSVTFDPSSAWDMGAAGVYRLDYRTILFEISTPASNGKRSVQWTEAPIRSNSIDLRYEGMPETGLNKAKPCNPRKEDCGSGGGGGGGSSNGSVSYVNCTTQQKNSAGSAVSNALTISTASYNDLADGSSSLYERWFGSYTSSRFSTVTSNFGSISNAFATADITINCSDADAPYYAYVYPSNPYVIYPAFYFFRAPANGRDSKAGTMVHEMSHFNVVAGTDDIKYGESACLQLARTQPRKAIKNADSHEYFAEDH